MVSVEWKGNMAFEAGSPDGVSFFMDAHPDSGGQGLGPSPVEALLSAAAACSAMDVISILHKKKQRVLAYKIEVDGERGPEGVYPRPFLSLRIRHILKGADLDRSAVKRAVELSDTKYCSVIATLRHGPAVVSEWHVED
jgi:putative redox protein